MKIFPRWLSRILIWTGPLLVLLLMIVGGFLVWALGTQQGTRWTLNTAAHYLDGRVAGVQGSLMHGLHVQDFAIQLPNLSVALEDFHLQANWRALLDRRLHVHDLSARKVAVHMQTSEEQAPSEDKPLEVPEIPVQILLDRLALGELEMTINGEPLPVDLAQLETSVALSGQTAQLVLRSLDVSHPMADVSLSGDVSVAHLQQPWPLKAYVDAEIRGQGKDSPLCLPAFVPGSAQAEAAKAIAETAKLDDAAEAAQSLKAAESPAESAQAAAQAQAASSTEEGAPNDPAVAPCSARVQLTADGSLDAMTVLLTGSGQGLELQANARLLPQAAFPLRRASIDLALGDGSAAQGELEWVEAAVAGEADRVKGTLSTRDLNVSHIAAGAIPDALLTVDGSFDVGVYDMQRLADADVSLSFGQGSRWNRQALSGQLRLALEQIKSAVATAAHTVAPTEGNSTQAATASAPAAILPAIVSEWRLPVVAVNLRIGDSHFRLDGALGNAQDRIKLDAAAPSLATLWPDLPGGFTATGELGGSVAQHAADLKLEYRMPNGKPGVPGSGPVQASVVLDGGWNRSGENAAEGWRGRLTSLRVDHAGFRVVAEGQTPVSYVPGGTDVQWRVGDARLQVWQQDDHLFTLHSQQAQGGHGQWASKGDIAQLRVTDARIKRLRETLQLLSAEDGKLDQGGVTVVSAHKLENDITFDLDWDLRFTDALEGKASIRRTSGDVVIPAGTPVLAELEALGVDITLVRASPGISRMSAEGQIATHGKGSLELDAAFLLRSTGGFHIDPADGNEISARAVVADLGWISIFTGDAIELGGNISADVRAQSQRGGNWASSGNVTGEGIRIVSLDQGVRLLDGTLKARFDNDRFILESLRFPARLRVEPKEWRTREWVYTNPDAQDGSLTLSGMWNLADSEGSVDIALYRYPILQRSDRYAMVTGDLRIEARLPALSVSGSLKADAGWIDLDILGGVPTVDSDVVVVRAGETPKQASAPMDISLDLEVDLGPRFYLTGYGLNSGLVGQLHLIMKAGKLTAHGALNTRGGAIEAYGQRLQLRRGTVTFQGDLTSPVLDIEALRTGVAVEAGVRVAGTARRPRIDLVSYPEVSEVEKLSWLLLGRGPDESGGDAALLFSVGTSFLSGGEPFYRRFGLDEVSLRSGELGAVGSILPAESVVRSLDSGVSDIERKFMVISKILSNGFTLSVEQALSDTGTVGRVSYRLARGLNAQASVGTVTGLALIYRYFSRE